MARPKEGKPPQVAPGKRPSPRREETPAKKAKYDKALKSHAAATNIAVSKTTRLEQKRVAKERKARRNKNFDLIQDVTGLWEQLRRHDTSAARRSELVSAILAKINGRVADLAGSHTASRVVQACVKYGTTEERSAILKQLEPKLLDLAKSPYGRFVVSKLIDVGGKDTLKGFLKAFKGHAAELLRHPAGTHVLDDLYTASSAARRNMMAAEFYGREYALFGEEGTLNNSKGAPSALRDLLHAVDAPKKRAILQHLAASITPVIDKGLVDCQLAHRLVAEYLEAAPASLAVDSVESLSGDALLHMLHTHHGAVASCMVLAYGSAKDRKKSIRALKGHIPAAVRDEWGHLTLITALSVVDDTALLKKIITPEIQTELSELVGHKCAHKVLLQLLQPYSSRYLPPTLLNIVRPEEKMLAAGVGGNGEEEGGDEEEEDDVDEEGEQVPRNNRGTGPLGASKKDDDLRRKELLDGGLGRALISLCTENGADFARTQYASDIIVEVCCGGKEGVLEDVVGSEAINGVHAAVISACTSGTDDNVLESYFGSRALRRVVLASAEDGASGKAAGRFVDALWKEALKGKCVYFHNTHAAKVVAATLACGRPAVASGAKAELKKAVKDVEGWAKTFVHTKKA